MANFKTRARTLDLLGRQQIAGIPTAINELLKNSHDAYADNVDIDYFRKRNIFVIRDDGVGMSRSDFESRWLTLGTESKVQHMNTSLPPVDITKKYRYPMGEKGIGRLAIASIGKQVLIITKAKNNDDITVALINWQIFELPVLNLDDITVPIATFNSIPDVHQIDLMKSELLSSVDDLLKRKLLTNEKYLEIKETINSFTICPLSLSKHLVRFKSFNSAGSGGTIFIVSPVEDIINSDIDGDNNAKEATKIEKMLMGFHNTMTISHPEPLLDIVFRDYRSNDDSYIDIIDKEHFFTSEDFEQADHHFHGFFDEFGQFKGNIRIYHEKNFEHIVNWSGNNFNRTSCGPFEINLAYVQGDKRHSMMANEDYARVTSKSDKFGGLYIYRDNIRILPYGDSDYDYLEIEKRRTKHAGAAFFSYRRMFGLISLSQSENFKLKEKAGREGFIEDQAYKNLRDILKNFFVQLAADFFRDDVKAGPKAEVWATKRNELLSSHYALEKRDKQAKAKKFNFENSINNFFNKNSSGLIEQEINSILATSEQMFNNIYSIKDPDVASQKIIDIESQTRKEVNDYKKSILVPAPRGFLLRGELKEDYSTYLLAIEELEVKCFKVAIDYIDRLVDKSINEYQIKISKRKRLEQAVDFISIEAKKVNMEKRKNTQQVVLDINKRVKELTSELMIDLDNQIRIVKDKFKYISIENESDIDLVAKRNELASEITIVSERNTNILNAVIRQLEGIYWEKDEDNNYITSEQISDVLGEEIEVLRERIHADVELSQLGLAVSIIHHEFNSTVRSIRSSLRDLKAWSDINEDLDGVYKNIKINFEHLDGYLNLFTPLNRRLQRKKEEIKLPEIKSFLIDLFKNRMDRHNISFKHTRGYQKGKLYGFRSSFYPVFVNVIDNAIYWLNEHNVVDKTIRLHADDEGSVYISNNGLMIDDRDKNRIFSLGFSRKNNGRGMGLHISNEVLESIGYHLTLAEPREGSTVTFKISMVES
ncbi:putative prophage encoded two-component system histidine kinase [Yersinia pseudotuberculosis]|uniref:ATP-binding protein n=1 Tax=Yersinia pseudotuberculosis TaxID=633 RepID=UPI0005DBC959|nr:ATP-binding protein [Yersinia pseudotuberculosis]CNF23366.1 putative prophage encoded two-component system histidine kinase [Yersinia pseudotuberculosis]CNK29905.1 putative prophage encoded two-component system histidine kinase [Yersinia pseudotuberculosis]